MEVMRRIVDDRWTVKYPPYMSAAGRDLIQRLLERKPAKRLGMLQGRAADIKNHKWFAVSALGDTCNVLGWAAWGGISYWLFAVGAARSSVA